MCTRNPPKQNPASSAIAALGGCANVSRQFGYKINRVFNWTSRGCIPADVILDDPAFAEALISVGYSRARILEVHNKATTPFPNG